MTVVEATPHDPFTGLEHATGTHTEGAGTAQDACIDVAIMCDVYHHLEYPKTACRNIRKRLGPSGRLVVIDFIRDPDIIKSQELDWVLGHLRAGQATFRDEILSCGYCLVEEPNIDALKENYVMVFRPLTEAEWDKLVSQPGGGWS